jgi:hypothetical protein
MGIKVPPRTTQARPASLAPGSARRSFGARATGSATVSFTYRQTVAVLTPNPAVISANGSPSRR